MTASIGNRAAATRVIAVVHAAGQRIGIAGEHIVQAVAVPADMGAVPRRAGGVAGVITLGEQLVPVLRLQDWLDTPAEAAAAAPDAQARIVVLRGDGLVVGLLVEAVVGMRRCPPGAVARLFHDERPDELFAGAVRLDADTLPLLEAARLAALANVWCRPESLDMESGAHAQREPVAPAAQRVGLGVFRIGDLLVGIPAGDIGELLVTPALRAPPLRHSTTRGLCDWRDRLLPVADIAGMLGARADTRPAPWMCVVRHGELVLGVLVDEILELQAAALPQTRDATAVVQCGLPTERGIVHVLDTAALMAGCPESGISRRAQAQAVHARLATSPHTYLVFDAGGCHAARIDGVQEILPLPDALRPRLQAGLEVSLAWRGHAVPVRPLRAGQALAPSEARLLLIVVAGDRRAAIPIVAVKAMIAPHTATLARLRVRGELVDVVSTAASASDRASYELVDLAPRAAAEEAVPGTA